MKRIYRQIIAILLVVALVFQNSGYKVSASQVNDDLQRIYVDGVEFEVVENGNSIEFTGEYEGATVDGSYSGGETVEVDVTEGKINKEYSLVFDDYENIIEDIADDVDIDAILDGNPTDDVIEDIIDAADIEDVLNEYEVDVYDEDDEFVDTIKLGGYEGQVALTVAGSASYYILNVVVSFVFTCEVYKVIKASTASKNNATRGTGKAIPKNKVPGKSKKNKTVKGKNGSLPITGTADSSTDLYSPNGKTLYQRRFYDGNGKVYLDIDFSHGGNHTFPHAHYWIWN